MLLSNSRSLVVCDTVSARVVVHTLYPPHKKRFPIIYKKLFARKDTVGLRHCLIFIAKNLKVRHVNVVSITVSCCLQSLQVIANTLKTIIYWCLYILLCQMSKYISMVSSHNDGRRLSSRSYVIIDHGIMLMYIQYVPSVWGAKEIG